MDAPRASPTTNDWGSTQGSTGESTGAQMVTLVTSDVLRKLFSACLPRRKLQVLAASVHHQLVHSGYRSREAEIVSCPKEPDDVGTPKWIVADQDDPLIEPIPSSIITSQ